MKVFVGILSTWQRAKLLTALYDNLALSTKFSHLSLDTARDLLAERKNDIHHVGNFLIGVDFNAKEGYIDLSRYNQVLLKNTMIDASMGEKVVAKFKAENGLCAIEPQTQSLLNACGPTVKPYTILSLPKPKEEQLKNQAVSVMLKPGGCSLGVGC